MDNKPMKSCLLKVLVFRDESIPDQWVSHCLDLNIVSQGDTVPGAMESLLEAVRMLASEDLADDFDPLHRKTAPPEVFRAFDRVLKGGSHADFSVDESKIEAVACLLELSRPHHPVLDCEPELKFPEPWLIASLHAMRGSDPCLHR